MALVLAIGACATSSSNAGNVRPEQGIEQLTHPRFSYPTWTPDGARILYESAVTGSWEIWMMDVQGLTAGGGTLTRITSNDHLDRMPAISPDGSSIVFISDRDGDYEVFRMNVDGSRPVQLTFNDLAEIHPYWSPDGRKIIYNRRVEGRRLYEIRMMDPDGSNDVRVLQDDELNSYARISPDGTRVVFDKWQGNDETNGEIYVLTLETGELRRLTENAVYDGYPAWFPDGERIAYASEVNGSFKLFSMRMDGSDRRQLTFGAGSDARPDVSRDGRRIVFNREIDGTINILILTLEPAPGATTGTLEPSP
jgi:TolB protein